MSKYVVTSAEGSLRNLSHLMSIICDTRFEQSAGEDDERIDSLLWIARDLTEGLLEHYENDVRAGPKRRKEVEK